MLLQSAGIRAEWSGAPSAEDIAKLDQERLLHHPLLTGELSEDDLVLAKALLAERSAEEVAAALVRMYRSQLPAAEEVFDPGPGAPSRDGNARAPREGNDRAPREGNAPGETRDKRDSRMAGNSVWFRMNIGRLKNADPRWLIPMICRHGKVTKQEIGSIVIQERDTRFEINAAVADRFFAATHQVDRPEVKIERLGDAPLPAGDRNAAKPPRERFKPKPHKGKAPWKAKPKSGA